MKLPMRLSIRHGFAQGCASVFAAFAKVASARHCFRAGLRHPGQDLRSQRCYPSPSLRSGPSQAGPFLCRGKAADPAGCARNCFEIRDIAVKSAAITTNLRGSLPCASPLSSSLFFPPPLPAVCRTLRRAGWPVPLQAPSSPMPPKGTCSPGPSLAGSRGSHPAASRSACRPVTRATDPAAFGRVQPPTRTIRARRPGGPFSLRLMGGADV